MIALSYRAMREYVGSSANGALVGFRVGRTASREQRTANSLSQSVVSSCTRSSQ